MKRSKIEFRVTFASGAEEYVVREAVNDTVALAMAAATAIRYDRKTGKRDHVTAVEFWSRCAPGA